MEMQDIVNVPENSIAERTVANVPIASIITNPFQPRKVFDNNTLQELADSIKEYGVLQPLLVVPLEDDQYLLIAGERRLRAAYLAELETIPVLLGNYSSEEVAEIAMIENLQREDLHFLDEAEGYDLLMKEFDITQEALAKKIGKNQSTIANKLRILKLDREVRDALRTGKLTERHARALLKLGDAETQLSVINAVVNNDLNVRQTEALVDGYITSGHIDVPHEGKGHDTEGLPAGKRTRVVRDVRIFVNSIKKVVSDIKKAGVKVKMEQKQTDKEFVLTMRIPLAKQEKENN